MKMERPLRLEWRDPADLPENEQNYKIHTSAQLLALRAALAELGWGGALLFNERTGRLIDGHARKKVARRGEKVPVLIGSWSKEDEAKLLASLDPIGAMAQIDSDALKALLGSVRFESSAITSLLESFAGESASLCIADPRDLKEPPDYIERADELAIKWGTVQGQLWQAGEHRIVCGDCRDEALLNWLWARSAHRLRLVWTDAPYGVNYGAKTAWMQKHGAQRRRASIANDSLKPEEIRKLFGSALTAAAKYAMPGAAVYATVPSGNMLPFFIAGLEDSGFAFKDSLVWIKNSMVLGRGDYHHRFELLLYGWLPNGAHYFIADRTLDSVFEIDRPSASPYHPTTKPIELIARLIMNSSRKGEMVYDPFCGSGTTLLACEQLGRIGFGVELDPRFCAVTLERLSKLGLKPKVLNTFGHISVHQT
jgi:DNA modification methylase